MKKQHTPWVLLVTLFLIYFVTHSIGVLRLPIFADEAIYLRWAQLLISDPAQYAFFALNDGKTPIFIWLLVPFLQSISDPLLAGRVLSIAVGALQVGVMFLLGKELTKTNRAGYIAATITAVVPYWFFYHRMALMDGLLTLLLSIYFLCIYKTLHAIRSVKKSNTTNLVTSCCLLLQNNKVLVPTVLSGIALGLAILTKLPAVLFIPSVFVWILLNSKERHKTVESLVVFTATVFISCVIFLSLALHPAFPQLFSRGSDFLFSTEEILKGAWITGLQNLPSYLSYAWWYLTPAGCILLLSGLFMAGKRRQVALLLLGAVIFLLPILLFGKVVYARYLLPAMIYLSLALALSLDGAASRISNTAELSFKKASMSIAVALLVAQLFSVSAAFMWYSWVNPAQVPFVSSDYTQYLTEWSAGTGTREVYEWLAEQPRDTKIVVATEGFFGSLPDGLLLYLFAKPLANVTVEGIGQPVSDIPEWFFERVGEYDRVLLVVNSHRLVKQPSTAELIAEYCRPQGAPCLQLWDYTDELTSK